jgi:hypothetical protein
MSGEAGGDAIAPDVEGDNELTSMACASHGKQQKLLLAPLLPQDSARGCAGGELPVSQAVPQQSSWQGRGLRERWWQIAEQEEEDDEEITGQSGRAKSSAAVPSSTAPTSAAATQSHGGSSRGGSQKGYAERYESDNASLTSSLGTRSTDQEHAQNQVATVQMAAAAACYNQAAAAMHAAAASSTQATRRSSSSKRRDEDGDLRTGAPRGDVDQMRTRLLTCTRLLRELQAENSFLNDSLTRENEQRVRLRDDAAALRRENAALRCENEALVRESGSLRQEAQQHQVELLQAHTALATIVPELERKLEATVAALTASEKRELVRRKREAGVLALAGLEERADGLERQLPESSRMDADASKGNVDIDVHGAPWSAPAAG